MDHQGDPAAYFHNPWLGGKLFHHTLRFLSENTWLGAEVLCDPAEAATGTTQIVKTGSSPVLSRPRVDPGDHAHHGRKCHQTVRIQGHAHGKQQSISQDAPLLPRRLILLHPLGSPDTALLRSGNTAGSRHRQVQNPTSPPPPVAP